MQFNEADLYNLYGRASSAEHKAVELEDYVATLMEQFELLEKRVAKLERKHGILKPRRTYRPK